MTINRIESRGEEFFGWFFILLSGFFFSKLNLRLERALKPTQCVTIAMIIDQKSLRNKRRSFKSQQNANHLTDHFLTLFFPFRCYFWKGLTENFMIIDDGGGKKKGLMLRQVHISNMSNIVNWINTRMGFWVGTLIWIYLDIGFT